MTVRQVSRSYIYQAKESSDLFTAQQGTKQTRGILVSNYVNKLHKCSVHYKKQMYLARRNVHSKSEIAADWHDKTVMYARQAKKN